MFGEGADSMKKSLEGIFDDTVQESKVKIRYTIDILMKQISLGQCAMMQNPNEQIKAMQQ